MLAAPDRRPDLVASLAGLHAAIHRCRPRNLVPMKERLARRISGAPGLGEGDRRRVLDRLRGLPEGDRLCHGDFHPFNVIGAGADARIVDWLDATIGDPAADLCRSHVLMTEAGQVALAGVCLAAGCAASGVARQRVFAWRAPVAAARLAETTSPDAVAFLLALVAEPAAPL
jgi:hypothetical protein